MTRRRRSLCLRLASPGVEGRSVCAWPARRACGGSATAGGGATSGRHLRRHLSVARLRPIGCCHRHLSSQTCSVPGCCSCFALPPTLSTSCAPFPSHNSRVRVRVRITMRAKRPPRRPRMGPAARMGGVSGPVSGRMVGKEAIPADPATMLAPDLLHSSYTCQGWRRPNDLTGAIGVFFFFLVLDVSLALCKPSGGVRGLAVGDLLRRIVARTFT